MERRELLKGAGALALTAGLGGIARARVSGPGGQLWQPPELKAGRDNALSAEISVRYGEFNLTGSQVRLRGYDGLPMGRTLRIRAGSRLDIRLKNELPFELAGEVCGPNVPHALNTTNLHLHGLHVSPQEPQDYILLNLVPRETAALDGTGRTKWMYDYKYDIHRGCPPGTYFYHAHYHGSVALQVSSGMAGALIVEGELDDIPEIRAAAERILMFQSQRFDALGRCEDYGLLDLPGHTYVNGQLAPVIVMAPGEVQRWRLINGTHDQMLDIALDWARTVLLCRDGNPLPKAEELAAPLRLVPGNRADLLVKAPLRPGRYPVRGPAGVATVEVVDAPPKDMPLFTGALPSYDLLRPIGEGEVTYGRRLTFGMTGAPPHVTYTVNQRQFSCTEPWTIPLGAVEDWVVVNQTNDIHPFHIHTNPFQLLEGGNASPGTWLDTVEIPPAGRIRFRTRFVDYTGTLVFHCHTLPHEDMGMMQALNVVKAAQAT